MKIDYSKFPRNNVYCIDAKSFYSSVECVVRGLDPLTTYLAVVGSLSRSGSVVLASSPLMKSEYNIKTGSRYYEIPKDPKIHVVEARMETYLQYSMQIPKIVNRFTPLDAITIYSVDELWATCDHVSNLFGDKWSVAKQIQLAIKNEVGIPTSIGIGNNYFQSKCCLDVLSKHSPETGYIAEVCYEDFAEKMWPTPIKKIWGIGSRMEKNLHRLGIMTLGDIANYPVSNLKRRFGILGEQLHNHSLGIDLTDPYHRPQLNKTNRLNQKGFSAGITLLRNYQYSEILTPILEQLEEVTRRARASKMAGRTITLSIGYSHDSGGGFSQAKTLHAPTNITMELYNVCKDIFEKNYGGQVVRSINVSLTNLEQDEVIQLDLFENKSKQRDLGYVMDSIKNKFGSTAIVRATSLTNSGTAIKRGGQIGGHNA